MMNPLIPIYARFDLAFDSGKGSWLFTKEGEGYLDFGSGIAVNALGHTHPHLVRALKKQAGKLWHTSNLVRIPEGERLARRLISNTFADVVFFANSGAEANEAAIKMARRYHFAMGRPERYRIITFEGAFHGRTLAMIAAGGCPKYLEGFGPKVDGFDQVALGDWDALEAAITDQTAALMLEPLQGEGGLRVVGTETLRRLRKICDRHGLLLILDEIQSGVGRTGRLFAHEDSGAAPDIMTVAKGIGGGFPLGACLASADAARGMTPGSHGATFGGNPLAMAAGNAVLDVLLKPSFLLRVTRKGEMLKRRLEQLQRSYDDLIAEVRGCGLLLGLQIRTEAHEFVNALLAERMLCIPAREGVVRLAPPLTVKTAEIVEAGRRLEAACVNLRERRKDSICRQAEGDGLQQSRQTSTPSHANHLLSVCS